MIMRTLTYLLQKVAGSLSHLVTLIVSLISTVRVLWTNLKSAVSEALKLLLNPK